MALFFYALPLLEPPIISTPDIRLRRRAVHAWRVYALVALGLNIVVGYAGLLDLGYVGFYAVGAYTVGVLTVEHGIAGRSCWRSRSRSWSTMISGVLLGAPTLRVRGDYLAIVTLGFGEIIRLIADNSDWLGEAAGHQPDRAARRSIALFEIPHLNWETGTPLIDLDDTTTFLEFGVLDPIPYYWLALTVVIIVLFADTLIKDSRVGRAWEATREDEDAAELMGVPDLPVQAAGLRHRRLRRRARRRALRQPSTAFISPRVVPCCCCRSCSSPPS